MDKRMEENLRVKRAIVNAFFALLKETNIENISVSEVTRVAQVSRMAYYRNFNSKIDIVDFFLDDVLADIMALLGDEFDYQSQEYGCAYFQVMKNHKDRILMLHQIGLSGMILNRFTATNEEFAGDMPWHSIERYRLYYTAGAAYNGAIEWIKNDCRESIEEMEKSLREFMGLDNHQ